MKDTKLTVTTHAALQRLHVSQARGGKNHYRIIEMTQLWTLFGIVYDVIP